MGKIKIDNHALILKDYRGARIAQSVESLASDSLVNVSSKFQARILQIRCYVLLINCENLQIYPPELQLNEAYTTNTEAPSLDLHFSIANEFLK